MGKTIFVIIFFAFLVRIINLGFPALTTDEARIVYRGYSLAKTGHDEFGRNWPIIFNSSLGYQLPLTTYLVTTGELIFGKNDLGARIPYILIGTLIVLLSFLNAKRFSENPRIWLISAILVAFCPPLIFLSKVPNDLIILTALFLWLFYILTQEKINFFLMSLIIILVLLTSVLAWIILVPFVLLTTRKLWPFLLSLLFVITVFLFFIKIPNFKINLMESAFPIFSDMTISNGINRLRGQGIESLWPPFLERLIFSKSHYLISGLLGWLSSFSLNIIFGQLDKRGLSNFINSGGWEKILIIPFLISIYSVLKRNDKKLIKLIFYIIVLTLKSFCFDLKFLQQFDSNPTFYGYLYRLRVGKN